MQTANVELQDKIDSVSCQLKEQKRDLILKEEAILAAE